MILEGETLVTDFLGRPSTWGEVIRTIEASSGRFTCTTTFGHRIAAACDDGTVVVYDSVTGALRLSLSPGGPVQAVRGSPDGSVLFCAHRGPSVTVWDIQTGGLIRTIVLESQVECIAICSRGLYLACGLSDGSVKIWEVENQRKGATFGSGSHITHLCWLEPGEQLVVARGESAQIWDVVNRRALGSFTAGGHIRGVVYAQKLDRFAIAATSKTESVLKVIDLKTGDVFTNKTSQRISCLAFSPITEELVCGLETRGLELFNVPKRSSRPLHHPAAIASVSMLSGGNAVANVAGSGIQLLSLDDGGSPPWQPTFPVLNVHSFDENNIIASLLASRDRILLLKLATMTPLSTIPGRTLTIPTDRPAVLCASLKHRIVVCWFKYHSRTRLELWRFGGKAPTWAAYVAGMPFVGAISPSGSRLVTIEHSGPRIVVRVRHTRNGKSIGNLTVSDPCPKYPLEVKFESEDTFYSHHDDYRVPFIISQSDSSIHTYSIIRQAQLPLAKQPRRYYEVDGTREWVVGSSKRICWIPPGYIGLDKQGYWWVGNTLIMSGQDGVLRKLTFR